MNQTAKGLAAMRNEIYQFLSDHGYKLLPADAKGLSKLLKSYHEHRTIEVSTPSGPVVVEHHLTCAKCQGVEVKTGWKGKMYAKALKEHEAKTQKHGSE